jgi:hypothetical protein
MVKKDNSSFPHTLWLLLVCGTQVGFEVTIGFQNADPQILSNGRQIGQRKFFVPTGILKKARLRAQVSCARIKQGEMP